MDGIRILQIFLFLIVVGVIYYLFRLYYALKLEKRLANFAIVSNKDKEISLFDNLANIIWKIVHKISKKLEKSEILTKYGAKYNKYISFEKREVKEGKDYLIIKFLIGFLFSCIYIISIAFTYKSFNILLCIIMFLIGFFVIDIILGIEFSQKQKKIEEDLLKAIIIMNSAFRSGRNIIQAVEIVKEELDGPIKDEFKKIYLDMSYGLSFDLVFERFYERIKLEDARYIATSLSLLNKTGGDIVKIFGIIERSIFDRKNLKSELNSLTSSSRFVFKILLFLPFIFSSLIFILNPSYFKPLISETLGIITLIFIILLYTLYVLVIKRILKVNL